MWWGLQNHVPAAIGNLAPWAYLIIAFVVLPPFIPLALVAIEPSTRRRLMMPFAVLGAGVAVVLAAAMMTGPVTAELLDYHIGYGIGLRYGVVIVSLYVAATCGSLLASSYRPLVVFGWVNLMVVAVLALSVPTGFASLWCGWAAVASAAIAMLLRVGKAAFLPRSLPTT